MGDDTSLDKDKKDNSYKDILLKYLDFLKEYLAIFVLVPTLLGGAWQLISLAKLGISYIRFFSISQLVSDGIIMIGALLLMSLITLYSYWMGKNLSKYIKEKKNNVRSLIIQVILHFAALIILSSEIVLGFKYLVSSFKMEIRGDVIALIFIFLPLINFVLQATSIKLHRIIRVFYYRKLRLIRNRFFQIIIKLANRIYDFYSRMVIFVIGLSVFFWVIFTFNLLFSVSNYYLADNLVNLSKIDELLLERYKLTPDDFRISYMNDTYIFIEYSELPQNQIDELIANDKTVPYEVIILKTDVLFE